MKIYGLSYLLMWFQDHARAGPSMKGATAAAAAPAPACIASGTTCMWCVCQCVCVCGWVCRRMLCVLCLFRIEVKRVSALKPALKSNKFAIVHSPQSHQSRAATGWLLPPYHHINIYISNNWPMANAGAECSHRWPFIMWNANKTQNIESESETETETETETESLSGQQLAK